MLKAAMLASIIGSMAMVANGAVNSEAVKSKPLDAQIIIEVDRDKATLTKEGLSNVQMAVYNNIKRYATNNVSLITQYSEILNAFAIKINKDDIELVKQVPGVKHVTLNELHWKTEVYSDGAIVGRSREVQEQGEYGDSENISATTMYKPEETEDGAGTVIAVLDNEFYLRGKHYDSTKKVYVDSWCHETFTALPSDTPVKHKGKVNIKGTHAKSSQLISDFTPLGEEGSGYFNSKVPFYFDYGGEAETYSGDPKMDLDVTSDMTYHGSHVASIATGNADDYKGIAPKAQLFCMKVFTNFRAKGIDKFMGLSSYSGAYDLPILNALEDCVTLGVDGINMSLGSNLDDFDKDSATRKVIRELTDSGIMTSISAGNNGKSSFSTTGAYGYWTKDMVETGILSGYANEAEAMTIASGQPTKIFYETAFNLANADVAYQDQLVNTDMSDTEYDPEVRMEELFDDGEGGFTKTVDWVYIPGFGRDSDYSGKTVSGKIAIVNRGNTNFSDKYDIAKRKGAIGLVIINNDPTAGDFNFRCSFGDDFTPSIPCALVLYKDRQKFIDEESGTISLIRKKVVNNPNAYSVSTFSSDGATFDLDLKPDITTPGENIRGAVPPQKIEDRTEERRLKVYEYLSGTSMAAPNYAGCQSLILSKVAGPIYSKSRQTQDDLEKILNYRNTVDMRLMSTADPMYDLEKNEENEEITLTSPRKQGAGMVNLEDAYATDIYLEGLDLNGNPIGKSKVALRNNSEINNGNIKISFLAHNETDSAEEYSVKLSVMRPAVGYSNEVLTGEYNDCGEVDSIQNFPGITYYGISVIEGQEVVVPKMSSIPFAHNDVYEATKDIQYYAKAEDYGDESKLTTIPKGIYYNAGDSDVADWKIVPGYEYQSIQDILIDEVDLADVTLPAGDNVISLQSYSLSSEAKERIASLYEYGCYIEGYVTLTPKTAGGIELSMPYLGFYSAKEGGDYSSCPITEPFSFEKDPNTIYPSALVNDIAKELLGKENHDMQSMWTVGYLPQGEQLNVDSVLKNDENFLGIAGFHSVGTDPNTDQPYDKPEENIYVGNPQTTNTMVIQQFMLRSVSDNFFTIKNKANQKIVYRNVLEDMLFGEQGGKYPLYKSHVDETYLGAGYVAHRAYAIIPLYNPETGKAFESGKYEIEFNYLLAGTNTWVKKSYTFEIDSDAPEVSSITTNGNDVTINIKEKNLTKVQVGLSVKDFKITGADTASVTINKNELTSIVNENWNDYRQVGRLYIKLTDKAYGEMGTIVKFKVNGWDIDMNPKYDFSKYTMVQHYSLTYRDDIVDDNIDVKIYKYDLEYTVETEIFPEGFVLISRGPVKYPSTAQGCGGNIVTTSVILSAFALLSAITLIISKKRKQSGGKN